MFAETDVIKLKRDISAVTLDGETVSLAKGSQGTIIIAPPADQTAPPGRREYVIEFGEPEDPFMLPVFESDIELAWSSRQTRKTG
ncbi:MAG TPA: hypothetical protein V6D08_07210 [Candidatus Obscuribacterales bacterium]